MTIPALHSFHIPVMGLAFTIDTPVKVARFGITSVVSIIEDNLIEAMRKFYCTLENEPYIPILKHDPDARARRITAYLNLLQKIVDRQTEELRAGEFVPGTETSKYFELLAHDSPLRKLYAQMMKMEEGNAKAGLQARLRNEITSAPVDVNIMTKCDRPNYSKEGEPLDAIYSDAMAALRGFANSNLSSSVVFSAGMNPRLYSYCESFPDFFPDSNGILKKKIILKVSDFRSALIQGRFLAKKGLFVSEFRIESGLNCGGHSFATDGYLMGPILEEFKTRKEELEQSLVQACNEALLQKGLMPVREWPPVRISVQGGIGTANENHFLLEHYFVDSTGWGSPFLLVPEVTNVDDETLAQLASAKKEDYFLSNASPLGVMFNNFKKSTGSKEREKRVSEGNPGSPCYNKYLSFNTEFTEKPICTASREYQYLKIKQLRGQSLPDEELAAAIATVTEKECICQGLGTSVFLKNEIPPPHKLKTVSVCPGPNLVYFSGTYTLPEMVDHIYGRKNILNDVPRPNMFINELNLYIDYFRKELSKSVSSITAKHNKYLNLFKENLLAGIEYYKNLAGSMIRETEQYRLLFAETLSRSEQQLKLMHVPLPVHQMQH